MFEVFKGVSSTIATALMLLLVIFSIYIFYYEVREHKIDLKILSFLDNLGMKTERSKCWFIVLLLSISAFVCLMMI